MSGIGGRIMHRIQSFPCALKSTPFGPPSFHFRCTFEIATECDEAANITHRSSASKRLCAGP
jgi:hypothetical protein